MCCIFTCCSWVIDLLQRFWAFAMTCCIASAVCCVLITASVAGIALGYNYSLAEFIHSKEANVSVHLRRRVFNDSVAQDNEWRRSGDGLPIVGRSRDENAVKEEYTAPAISGRRKLNESISESDQNNRFEGSLMRLTTRPPDASSSIVTLATVYSKINDVVAQYPKDSLDQLKAIQSLINMQKSVASNFRRFNSMRKSVASPMIDEQYLPPIPYGDGRRMMSGQHLDNTEPNNLRGSLRLAVPDESLNEQAKWYRPKLAPNSLTFNPMYVPIDIFPTYPQPVTPRYGPIRPTRTRAMTRKGPERTETTKIQSTKKKSLYAKRFNEDILDAFKENIMLDKFDPERFKEDDIFRVNKEKNIKSPEEYDQKGSYLNVRRKRVTQRTESALIKQVLKRNLTKNNKLYSTQINLKKSHNN